MEMGQSPRGMCRLECRQSQRRLCGGDIFCWYVVMVRVYVDGNTMPVVFLFFYESTLCFRCLHYSMGSNPHPADNRAFTHGYELLIFTEHVHYLPGYTSLQVEDIVDSGLTGQGLVEYFSKHAPASIKMVSLLSKPSRRQVPFEPDYLGFTIEDRFVVGFGLDYQERYRSLPYIGILRQEKVNE